MLSAKVIIQASLLYLCDVWISGAIIMAPDGYGCIFKALRWQIETIEHRLPKVSVYRQHDIA